jgi:hypothetical protein
LSGKKHLCIPDVQGRPKVPLNHLVWAGKFAVDKRPDTIIQLGDWYDMNSLSEYDRSERPGEFHARSFQADLDAGDKSVDLFEDALAKAKGYKPKKIYLLGNHEDRYDRMINADPRLNGAIRAPWAYAQELGWEVIPFLKVIEVDGVLYSHYFCRGPSGTVTNARRGSPSARAQVLREMQSCTAGHKQGLDVHIQPTAHGMMRGIIAGSFYQHDEVYLSPQGTKYWRGVLMKHEVSKGNYNLMEVSLDYLKKRYN